MIFLKSIAIGAILTVGYWFLDQTIGAYVGHSASDYGMTFVGSTTGALIYGVWNT